MRVPFLHETHALNCLAECVRKLLRLFFFQAEDGIRDYKVTGVQTCALPICGGRHADRGAAMIRLSLWGVDRSAQWPDACVNKLGPSLAYGVCGAQCNAACDRSEERRVGKSVDLGGRRIIKKKKCVEPSHTRA